MQIAPYVRIETDYLAERVEVEYAYIDPQLGEISCSERDEAIIYAYYFKSFAIINIWRDGEHLAKITFADFGEETDNASS